MNGKKFVFIGLLTLLIIGCVAAAGCTDSSSSVSVEVSPTPAASSEDTGSAVPLVTESDDVFEIWGGVDPSGTHGYFVFYNDGTGARYIESGHTYRLDHFTWTAADHGYDMIFDAAESVTMRVPLQFNEDHTALTDTSGLVLTKQTEVPALQ